MNNQKNALFLITAILQNFTIFSCQMTMQKPILVTSMSKVQSKTEMKKNPSLSENQHLLRAAYKAPAYNPSNNLGTIMNDYPQQTGVPPSKSCWNLADQSYGTIKRSSKERVSFLETEYKSRMTQEAKVCCDHCCLIS